MTSLSLCIQREAGRKAEEEGKEEKKEEKKKEVAQMHIEASSTLAKVQLSNVVKRGRGSKVIKML